jgi:hypothetical protein
MTYFTCNFIDECQERIGREVDSSMTIQVVVNIKRRNTRTDVDQMINDTRLQLEKKKKERLTL